MNVIYMLRTLLAAVCLGLSSQPASAILTCTPAVQTGSASQTVSLPSPAQGSQTFAWVIRLTCTSSSGGESGVVNVRASITSSAGVRTGSYLVQAPATTSVFPYVIGYVNSFSTNPSGGTTAPSCSGNAPTRTETGNFNLATSRAVTVSGGSAAIYYWRFCVRVPPASTLTGVSPGDYSSTIKMEVTQGGSGTNVGTGSSLNITLTTRVPSSCTVGALGTMVFNYTSFITEDSTLSQELASVSCNSGSWKVDIRDSGASAVTSPLNGTVRGVSYVLGLSNNGTVPAAIGLNPSYPPTGTLNGLQTIFLLGRAAKGQAGDIKCDKSPCVTSRAYTLTITFD